MALKPEKMAKVGGKAAYISNMYILLQWIPDENYLEIELKLIKPTYQIWLHQYYHESISDRELRTEEKRGKISPKKGEGKGGKNPMHDKNTVKEQPVSSFTHTQKGDILRFMVAPEKASPV